MSVVPKGIYLKDRHKRYLQLKCCPAKRWGADSGQCVGTTRRQQKDGELVGWPLAWQPRGAVVGSTGSPGNLGPDPAEARALRDPSAGLPKPTAPAGPALGAPLFSACRGWSTAWGGVSSSSPGAQARGAQ